VRTRVRTLASSHGAQRPPKQTSVCTPASSRSAWLGATAGSLMIVAHTLWNFHGPNVAPFRRRRNAVQDGEAWRRVGLDSCLSSPRVYSLLIDREDRLWVGTYLGGVCLSRSRASKL
jgi:two component regulator with propeller domain